MVPEHTAEGGKVQKYLACSTSCDAHLQIYPNTIDDFESVIGCHHNTHLHVQQTKLHGGTCAPQAMPRIAQVFPLLMVVDLFFSLMFRCMPPLKWHQKQSRSGHKQLSLTPRIFFCMLPDLNAKSAFLHSLVPFHSF